METESSARGHRRLLAGCGDRGVALLEGSAAVLLLLLYHTPWLLAALLLDLGADPADDGLDRGAHPVRHQGLDRRGPREHALVVAAFGVGGAVGSFWMATRRMHRRHEDERHEEGQAGDPAQQVWIGWGAPLALIGFTSSLGLTVSMAGAGASPPSSGWPRPISSRVLTPALVAVLAILWARLPANEIAHPLDRPGNVAT